MSKDLADTLKEYEGIDLTPAPDPVGTAEPDMTVDPNDFVRIDAGASSATFTTGPRSAEAMRQLSQHQQLSQQRHTEAQLAAMQAAAAQNARVWAESRENQLNQRVAPIMGAAGILITGPERDTFFGGIKKLFGL